MDSWSIGGKRKLSARDLAAIWPHSFFCSVEDAVPGSVQCWKDLTMPVPERTRQIGPRTASHSYNSGSSMSTMRPLPKVVRTTNGLLSSSPSSSIWSLLVPRNVCLASGGRSTSNLFSPSVGPTAFNLVAILKLSEASRSLKTEIPLGVYMAELSRSQARVSFGPFVCAMRMWAEPQRATPEPQELWHRSALVPMPGVRREANTKSTQVLRFSLWNHSEWLG